MSQAAANDQPQAPRPKRAVQVVFATGFALRMNALAKMEAKERKEFLKKTRIELSVADLRDATLSVVHNTYGRAEGAFYDVHERGGPHHRTLSKWEDGTTLQPRLETIRRALLVCGKDLGIVG